MAVNNANFVTELLDCLVAAARDAGSASTKLARAEAEREWCASSLVPEKQRALRSARAVAQRADAALDRARARMDNALKGQPRASTKQQSTSPPRTSPMDGAGRSFQADIGAVTADIGAVTAAYEVMDTDRLARSILARPSLRDTLSGAAVAIRAAFGDARPKLLFENNDRLIVSIPTALEADQASSLYDRLLDEWWLANVSVEDKMSLLPTFV